MMSYIRKIEESKRKVYNQAVAQRILDLIDKLRLNSNENDERRWVWELMQNAKDVALERQPVSIQINFYPDVPSPIIEFKHNGSPFTIDNITFLIEQVSTKDRETINGQKPKTTGKFGTGFLSTHLLSEIVALEGVVKEPGLPFKKFNLVLDRRGTQIDEIILSVNESLQLLSSLDEKETFLDYNQNELNTCFRYLLDNDGIKAAQKGLDDLEISLPFTLAFVPSIKSVSVNTDIVYSLEKETIVLGDQIEVYTILRKSNKETVEFYIAVLGSERIRIAVQVDYQFGEISLVEPNSKLPKLFCDFPLIGSEDFNIPIIINSSLFNPTEQRNGIFLSDKSDHKIVENKMLMIEAQNLYFKLLNYAANNNWDNMHILADIEMPKAKEWISKDWISDSFLSPIRKKLICTPIIDTPRFGRIPIECGEYKSIPKNATVDFPKHPKKTILEKLWKLCDNQYFILPLEKDHLFWSKIIWDDKYTINLNRIVQLIEAKKDLATLSNALGKTVNETIDWLNNFYMLLNEEAEVIKDITNKPLYPNQNGIFKRKDELLKEIGIIPEPLKEIIKELGEDVKEILGHTSLQIIYPQTSSYSSDKIASSISKLIRPRLTEIPRTEETRKIFKSLYLWFSQYNKEAEEIFDELYKNKHKLLDDNEIVTSIKKAEVYDQLLKTEPNLSLERIQELLEIEALSNGFSTEKNYSPEERQRIINFENGWKGEAFVYKTLIAKNITASWPNKSITETSKRIVDFEGEIHYIDDKSFKYDLIVSMPDNKNSFIQVKSTTTDISRADEIAMPISVREWKFINEKSVEDTYYLARVFNVNTAPEVYFMKVENSILDN